MEPVPGLREQKKQRTREHLAATALRLFLERGFDEVSVVDVAAAAQVSKPTLFRYFPSKEDLLLDRFADHQGEAARVVRARPAGQTPVQALHEHFLDRLREHDPATGLSDHPDVVAFQRLLYGTASLQSRLLHYLAGDVELLAEELATVFADPLGARLAALHLLAVRNELGRRNFERIAAGCSAAEAYPAAVADAGLAYGMLAEGIGGVGIAPGA
ncbi:TetR/AcrR family transcriptional regulator [Kitasatospora sp. NBC_01250]|uniref:TetR family transcriptional regulator n=1 Tax=Kitasatospora sp. NBC_01250 TaxID=2903571 RepID=UPI002E3363F7|nr:TetR family transcriptional regulator [Kitasatospora sp. NBC_01250]